MKIKIKTQIYLLLIIFGFIFSSCSSLSKTQIRKSKSYFNALENYCNYASELNNYIADAKFKYHCLIASSTDSSNNMIQILDSAINNFESDITMTAEMRMAISEIDSYTGNYSFKSSYDTDFLKNLKTFMVEYIPFGVGSILYEIIYSTRKYIIKPNIGRKVKKLIEEGNEIISINAKIVAKESEIYISETRTAKEQISGDFKNFLERLKSEPDSWDKFSKLNPIYTDIYGKMHYSYQMAEHLKSASEKLDSAQISLFLVTRNRKNIKAKISALSDFQVEVGYLVKISMLLNRYKALEIQE
ncbi:MAG: hypothetical protein ABIJ97_07570 [Bacteroidota bacterium]